MSVAICALVLNAQSRSILPEPPLGTGAGAFSGGGVAFRSGPNALFINPAALSISDGFEAEAGMMGLSSGMSPYFLYGSNVGEHSTYALGYYFDGRSGSSPTTMSTGSGEVGGAARQGILVGGSWDIDPKAALGVSVHSQGIGSGLGLKGFGVDVDVGALLRPRKSIWAGMAIRNLEESGVGQEPGGYRTLRSYLVAVGFRRPVIDMLKIRFHDPNAFYEMRTWGTPPSNFAHAFSLGAAFLPEGKLALRGTFLIPHRGHPGFAFGSFLNFPAGMGGIIGGYTFDSGNSDDVIGEHGPSHSLSFSFHRSDKLNALPLLLEVQADKLMLRPDSTGEIQVYFQLSTGAPIKDWTLAVHAVGTRGQTGERVKVFEGKDLPPRLIRWEGRDEAGVATPPGLYAFRFSARNVQGRESTTTWQLLERLGAVPVDSVVAPFKR